MIYVAKLADAIFVLHCFKKTTQKISANDLAIARSRYGDVMRDLKS